MVLGDRGPSVHSDAWRTTFSSFHGVKTTVLLDNRNIAGRTEWGSHIQHENMRRDKASRGWWMRADAGRRNSRGHAREWTIRLRYIVFLRHATADQRSSWNRRAWRLQASSRKNEGDSNDRVGNADYLMKLLSSRRGSGTQHWVSRSWKWFRYAASNVVVIGQELNFLTHLCLACSASGVADVYKLNRSARARSAMGSRPGFFVD